MSRLITYKSGGAATQIDFMLLRKSKRKCILDIKVIPGEEVTPQFDLPKIFKKSVLDPTAMS